MGVIMSEVGPHVRHRAESYIDHPYFCPWCEHGAIEATKLEAFENKVYQWVRCDKCKKEWHDIYQLVNYEEIEQPLDE